MNRLRRRPDWEEIAPVLEEAVGGLGKADREAVLLRFYQQKPLAEVGRAMGVSEEAARKRVERAVGKLRGMLAEEGGDGDGGGAVGGVGGECGAGGAGGVGGGGDGGGWRGWERGGWGDCEGSDEDDGVGEGEDRGAHWCWPASDRGAGRVLRARVHRQAASEPVGLDRGGAARCITANGGGRSQRSEVASLIRQVRRNIVQQRYPEALVVIDRIREIDPENDYAKGVRPLVEDRARLQSQRQQLNQ